MSLREQAKENRVKLANILNRAGYNQDKILKAIGFPPCTGFSINGDPEYVRFDDRPDDDFRIIISETNNRKGGKTIVDGRRSVSLIEAFAYSYNDNGGGIKTGYYFFVDTYDHGHKWENNPYKVDFIFEDRTKVSIAGGNAFNGDSTSEDLFSVTDYYDNGFIVIPPPEGWPWPEWLEPVIKKDRGTGRLIEHTNSHNGYKP
jgi:hypothetical protein